jgi:glycosyltransferase involved in cell wall biosynthesis
MRAVIALDQLFCDFKNNDLEVLILGVSNNQGFTRLINKPKFKHFGYVDDRELDALYKNAYAFIYPSLNEGFGYPPLESMKHATPVLASAIASITEICGDAVIYFNPYSIQEQ